MEYQLVNNESEKQFEFHLDDHVPRIEYIKTKNEIYLTHTEVPRQLEGQGVGFALVKKVLEEIETYNVSLIPLCPFVAVYMKRHPEWKRLLKKGINI